MSIRLFATLAVAALVSACASQQSSPPSGKVQNAVEARATVTAVDPATRTVSLKEANGDELDVAVTEEVRNFDQIKPGDEVVVTYTEALAWQVKPASQGAPGLSENVDATRAQPGEKPSGAVGRSVTMTATITAIDIPNSTVTLTGPGGDSRSIKARNPDNLKKVKVGDLVDITYSENVALAVKEVAKQ